MAEKKAVKIVCLGDSITYGFPFGPTYSWVKMLSKKINGEVINRGINGNTTSDMLARFDRHVVKYNPTHVIIMGGINDVLCHESFDRIIWNLQAMIEEAGKNNIRVILGLPTAVDEPECEVRVNRIRVWMRQYAGNHGIKIIDFAGAFYDERRKIITYLLMPDGSHPTEEGYQAMLAQIDLNIFA
jgi:acyl-CoA thioesterase I